MASVSDKACTSLSSEERMLHSCHLFSVSLFIFYQMLSYIKWELKVSDLAIGVFDIDKDILENIDIDMAISENIDIDIYIK